MELDLAFAFCGIAGAEKAFALAKKGNIDAAKLALDAGLAKPKTRRAFIKSWDRALIRLGNSDPQAYHRRLDALQYDYIERNK